LKAKEVRHHQGVWFRLFHWDGLPGDVYCGQLPPPLDWTDDYLQSAVDQTFSGTEVEALRQYFANWEDTEFSAEPARPVADGMLGVGIRAVGGRDDFYLFWKCEDYPLPFRVAGYYDLSRADSGPYVRDPGLSLHLVSVDDQGQIVWKRPPF
jgi:hypothetical protein